MTFSTDGVRVSRSSLFEIWPITVTINELSVYVKTQFLILSSLWFGNGKPIPETFFRPFVEESRV